MSHREYRNENGIRYPSVTEVLSYPPKPWLEKWKQKWGKRAEQKSQAARNIGSDFHALIETGGKHKAKYKRSLAMFDVWLKWAAQNGLRIKEQEQHVVSNKHKFQGTFDAIGTLRKL